MTGTGIARGYESEGRRGAGIMGAGITGRYDVEGCRWAGIIVDGCMDIGYPGS